MTTTLTTRTPPGTRSGLALDLPPRFLTDAFGPHRIVHFEDIDFPPTLTHAPTRHFLREHGLPEEGGGFALNTDVPLPTLAEHWWDAPAAASLPPDADDLIHLGHLHDHTALLVHGRTGAILTWTAEDPAPHPLTRDLSTLAAQLLVVPAPA
ncbi:SUKH-4 family immunity protein [Streptomyces sp. NPDC048182]|uniref:SUKH-4 family immunity protein n=1 Tax=Streptomyces sp. NPDC048182 TaxID=3365507 RepID=UPI0037238194